MTYLHQGIRYSDNGVFQFVVSDAPGASERHDGWARDSLGRGYVIAAPQPVAYRHQGRSFTTNGALIVNSGSGAVAYTHQGYNFDVNGSMYLSGVSSPTGPPISGYLAWYQFNTGITVTGSGVSQWNDQSANAFHLLQGTDTNRPGNSSGVITFDGSDNFLAVAFGSLKAQPLMIYMRARQITYTSGDVMVDATTSSVDSCAILQSGTTPRVALFADLLAPLNTNWAVDTNFYSVAAKFNGASSALKIGATTIATGNSGTRGMNGLTLGSVFGHGGSFANFSVKEVILYEAAHSEAQMDSVIAYLETI